MKKMYKNVNSVTVYIIVGNSYKLIQLYLSYWQGVFGVLKNKIKSRSHRNNNTYISSFIVLMMLMLFNSASCNMTGVSSGAWTAYSSGATRSTPGF
jgi:hypothetical protein